MEENIQSNTTGGALSTAEGNSNQYEIMINSERIPISAQTTGNDTIPLPSTVDPMSPRAHIIRQDVAL